ncbi:MAG: hypothetical protein HYZ11_08295 [Candidatus Tectomicrobia bacterium]|uniref:Uncharacterized protein n=1 Tax=Tectimicrobiota bacterium TaxID=2528274 RepID=A0A932MNH7_UNCTE|nr:hypothetical protein [Candidatus Tectomicrobia bacterium]
MVPIALILAILALAPQAFAAEAQEPRRVDLFDKDSRRTGHAVIEPETGRVDLYDAKSRRQGYGKVQPGGGLELFDLKGNRLQGVRPSLR